jgi:hypothetical protein
VGRKSPILWRDRGCAVGVHDRQGSGIGRHIVEGWNGCAVEVHDRQDSGIGKCIAVGSRNGRPVGRSQCIAQNTQNRVARTVTNAV